MRKLKFNSDIPSLILWSFKTGWRANKTLFVLLNLYRFVQSSGVLLLNTYLLAKLTGSVAALAQGTVTLRSPLLYALAVALVNIVFIFIGSLASLATRKYESQIELELATEFHTAINQLNQEQIDDDAVQSKITIADRNFYHLRGLSDSLVELASNIVAYVTSVLVVLHYSVAIGILLLAVTPLLVFSNVIKGRREQKSWQDTSPLWREQYSARDMLLRPESFFQLTLLGARERLQEYWKHLQVVILRKELKVARSNELLELAESTGREAINVSSKVWAIVLVSQAKLAFDQFLFIMGLIEQAINTTWNVSRTIRSLHEGIVAGRAGKDVIQLQPLRNNGTLSLFATGDGVRIELNNVSFGYKQDKPLFENMNLVIQAGEKIAIVGENGAGKTSLVRLILGQYAPRGGDVLWDEKPIAQYDAHTVYPRTSVLLQSYQLMYFLSIRQNFQMASSRPLSDSEIFKALDMVGLTSFVRQLKYGLDTVLDSSMEKGTNFSGGQMQRLAVARGFARETRLLILDEPTSAVDAKAEDLIFNNIFTSHSSATTIIISHRFSTVRKADRIIVVENGNIIQDGSHEKLMRDSKGVYYDMFTKQAEGYK